MARNLAYFLLIVFLILASAAVFVGFSTLRGAQQVINPVGELVQRLVVQATPVILPNPVMVVREINTLARLETTSYSFQDVVQVERNQDVLWGVVGESLLFVAYGDVIAGVDMAQMQTGDLQVVDPTTVVVHLPDAEVFLVDLDNEESYVADRDVGFFANADPQLETMVRQEAEKRMLEAALEDGILNRADQEAERFITQFLRSLGFEEIIFTDDTPPPVTPYAQEVPKGYALTPVPTPTVPSLP